MNKLAVTLLAGALIGGAWISAYLYYSAVRYTDINQGFDDFYPPGEAEKMKAYLISRKWVEYPVPYVIVDVKKAVCKDKNYWHRWHQHAAASKYPILLTVEGSVFKCLTTSSR